MVTTGTTVCQMASRCNKALSHLWTDGLASWEVSFSLGTLVTNKTNTVRYVAAQWDLAEAREI